MRYDFFELLEEAHSHGRGHKEMWDEQKSFKEFLMQYNLIKPYLLYRNKSHHKIAALSLREQGYTIREIAKILGYKHPGSITHLLTSKP